MRPRQLHADVWNGREWWYRRQRPWWQQRPWRRERRRMHDQRRLPDPGLRGGTARLHRWTLRVRLPAAHQPERLLWRLVLWRRLRRDDVLLTPRARRELLVSLSFTPP